MAIEIPAIGFKAYHNWEVAPHGSVVRVSDSQNNAIGIRCIYRDVSGNAELLFVPEGNGAAFLRVGEIHAGGVDLSDTHHLVVTDPIVQSLTAAHHEVQGLVLVGPTGGVYAKGRMANFRALLVIRPADGERQWDVLFEFPHNLKLAGVVSIVPKKL